MYSSLKLLTTCAFGILLLLGAALTAQAQCIDLTGAWNVIAINPPGDKLLPETFPGTMNVAQSGCSLSGNIYGNPISGNISGSALTFTRFSGGGNCDVPGQTVNQIWSGTVSSNGLSITGTYIHPTCGAGTWTAVKSAALVDPVVPALLNGPSLVTPTTPQNIDALATQGRPVRGVAADGVAELLIRIPAENAGDQFTLTLDNDQGVESGSADEDGAVGNPGDTSFTESSLTVTAVNTTNNGPMAFAVYRAPVDFVRPTSGSGSCNGVTATDDQLACRTVSLQIEGPSGTTTTPITIVRTPVVLVHGNWSDRSAWQFFAPLVSGLVSGSCATSDTRFHVYCLDYSRDIQFGVAYIAPHALVQLVNYKQRFKTQMQVAAVQVDVVAYSMGGLVARDWVALAQQNLLSFFRPTNFNQGDVHKLITFDTPHWGSEEANHLLATGIACRSLFDLAGNPVGQNITDFAVGSTLLQNLNRAGNSIHLRAQVITGTADAAQTTAANNAYSGSKFLTSLCHGLLPAGGYSALFTTSDNPTGDSDLVVSEFSQLASNLGIGASVFGTRAGGVIHTINRTLFPLGPDVLNRTFDISGNIRAAASVGTVPSLVINVLNTPLRSSGTYYFQEIAP